MGELTKSGILAALYRDLLDEQGWVCWICGDHPPRNKKLAIDHDHETGEIRGLLCLRCNALLGRARDNKYILQSAINYLEKPTYWTDYDWVKNKGSEFFKCSMKDINKIFWKNSDETP